MGWAIWAAAASAYVLFRLWYDSRRAPLQANEIDALMARMAGTAGGDHNDLAVVRDFLEHDDGREFLMVNLVKVRSDSVPHPHTGQDTPARELMQQYTRAFLPLTLRRAGHPVMATRKVGGYLDAWHVGPDPGWSIVGVMRYRSRRDMAEMVLEPRYSQIQPLKVAACAETFSFPTRTMVATHAGPRVWIALVLALAAALAQLMLPAA
jgi:hypothetical protein